MSWLALAGHLGRERGERREGRGVVRAGGIAASSLERERALVHIESMLESWRTACKAML